MRKLLTFLIALGAVALGVCSPASAWGCREFGRQGGTGCNSVIASAPPSTPIVTYQSNPASTQTSGSSGGPGPWTVTGVNIGAAYPTRRVIVIVYGGAGANTVASATIDGGAGPIAANTPVTGGSNAPFSIYSAIVPTGTTATIIQTMTGNFYGASSIQAYTVDDSLLSSPTPVASFSDAASSPISGSVAKLSGGFEIVAVGWNIGGSKTPDGFSASSPSLSNDLSDGTVWILGSANGISAGTGMATATWTGSANATMMMAAFR